jgi:protein-S-isoprenylcysteine O-methyltransferase Ste14
MKASAIEFRLRMMINMVIIVFGFNAPGSPAWNALTGAPLQPALLEWLPLQLSRAGLVSFTVAVPAVLVIASILAGVAAIMRVWGAAWLGPGTVINAQMKADGVMAGGPYRYVRNPLYIGVWFMVAALAFLMSPIGALITTLLITFFQFRLILGEEAFLATQLGPPYLHYLRAVPRLIPRLRTTLPPSTANPQWVRAILTELTPVGIFIAMAFVSWRYDYMLMARTILVVFGVSLVVRSLMPAAPQPAAPPPNPRSGSPSTSPE